MVLCIFFCYGMCNFEQLWISFEHFEICMQSQNVWSKSGGKKAVIFLHIKKRTGVSKSMCVSVFEFLFFRKFAIYFPISIQRTKRFKHLFVNQQIITTFEIKWTNHLKLVGNFLTWPKSNIRLYSSVNLFMHVQNVYFSIQNCRVNCVWNHLKSIHFT